MRTAGLTIAVAMLVLGLDIGSAEARIRCSGPWQIVEGRHIASPYCGDNYLAQVARQYGMSVSARAIRQSYTRKTTVCQLIGHDNRVRDICTGFREDRDGDRGLRGRR